MGLTLGSIFEMQALAKEVAVNAPGWAKAKSIIMLYLQGGPSHLDLWDPKDNVPDNVKSVFKEIPTKIPGIHFTELLPRLAKINDKMTIWFSQSLRSGEVRLIDYYENSGEGIPHYAGVLQDTRLSDAGGYTRGH